MKCSVQKDTNFSDKHGAEFLYFNLSILKAKFKNLAVFANKYKPFGNHLLAMFVVASSYSSSTVSWKSLYLTSSS